MRSLLARTSDVGCERGGMSVFIVMLLPVILAFAGLTWDAANALANLRQTDNAAASIARAAAQAVELSSIYEHGDSRDGRAEIDQDGARGRAQLIRDSYVDIKSMTVQFDTAGSGLPDIVVVTIEREYETSFLALIGIDTLSISSTASARARSTIRVEDFNNENSF